MRCLNLYPDRINDLCMRIGIILHGPEIVDEGGAKRIIGILGIEHDIIARLGGTMGRTAVLDAGLEGMIDISKGMTPSETINALKGRIDLAMLLNHGKTLKTGLDFGRIVASRIDTSIPFVHIERPDSDGRIFYYSPGSEKFAGFIRELLANHYGKYDLAIERDHPMSLHTRTEGGNHIRRIKGVFSGENIRVDGVVIGHATHPEPEIVCRDGRIVDLRGGKIKPHGLEKLMKKKIDLYTAKVKTGNIRRSRCKPRVKAAAYDSSKVAIIDHCAESTFELVKDACIVITVGDDTTAIAADILARLGIPIVGITDGDLDSIIGNTEIPAGSVIIRVREGFDDIVGRDISEKLMHGKLLQEINCNEITEKVIALAGKYIEEIKRY